MVYMGSKNKIAKYLLPRILKNRKLNQAYVEPFTGGANMIDKVDGVRIGGELNEYIVAMWLALLDGWIPRIDYTREEYKFIRQNPDIDKAFNNVMKQLPQLLDVCFIPSPYDELFIPDQSIIYCDPPYKGTTGYKDKFNHDKFYQWCREMVNDNQLFISEYTAPDDFIPVWSKTVNVHLSTKCNNNIEQLFIHESQLENYLYGY